MNAHLAPSVPLVSIDTSRPGIPLIRLIGVELRKSFNTRAGRWFSISILGLCLVVMLVQALLLGEGAQDFSFFILSIGGTLGYFLPIIPIMLVTQEWGQRTGLVTFTLEPRRSRIVLAKFVAGLTIAVAVIILSFGIAALGAALADYVRGVEVSWELTGAMIRNFVIGNLAYVLIGFAIAMLLTNTAAAIVVYFVYSMVLPTVVGILGFYVDWFLDLAPWIEFNTAMAPLFAEDGGLTGEQWAQLATSGLLWVVLPLVLGVIRLLRAEVK